MKYWFILLGFLWSCGSILENKALTGKDLTPPVLHASSSGSAQSIELLFDEPVECTIEQLQITPQLAITQLITSENSLVISTATQTPGAAYVLEARIDDTSGNSLVFSTRFYGFNPQPAHLLINEFTTKGTASHPDLVELWVSAAGSMAGIVLYLGTDDEHTDKLIFPDFYVAAGDYILVHCKPQGIAAEKNELSEQNLSGGIDASASAYDFWLTDGTGLSSNNGVLSVYIRPGGPLMDAVLYSNRTSESDQKYAGFGTSQARQQAFDLANDQGWLGLYTGLCPQDGINPDLTTSTRSFCRKPGPDTDTRRDWYIVPTRGSTFGAANSAEIYVDFN